LHFHGTTKHFYAVGSYIYANTITTEPIIGFAWQQLLLKRAKIQCCSHCFFCCSET